VRKYQGAKISVSGGTDISGASSGGRGGPGGGPGGGGGGFNRLNILIQGPDIEQLQQYTLQLMEKVRDIPGVVDVDTNFEIDLRVVNVCPLGANSVGMRLGCAFVDAGGDVIRALQRFIDDAQKRRASAG